MTTPAARINCSYPNAAAIKAIGPNDRQNGDPAYDAETGAQFHFDADSSASISDKSSPPMKSRAPVRMRARMGARA